MAHDVQPMHNGTMPIEDEVPIVTPIQDDVCSPSFTVNETVSEAPLGQWHRIKHPSMRLCEYVTNTLHIVSPSLRSPLPSHLSGRSYPLTNYVTYDKFSTKHHAFLATIGDEREPRHFSEAIWDAC